MQGIGVPTELRQPVFQYENVHVGSHSYPHSPLQCPNFSAYKRHHSDLAIVPRGLLLAKCDGWKRHQADHPIDAVLLIDAGQELVRPHRHYLALLCRWRSGGGCNGCTRQR